MFIVDKVLICKRKCIVIKIFYFNNYLVEKKCSFFVLISKNNGLLIF